MGMIKIYERSSKTPRKPGWQQREAEHAAWLKGLKSMTTNFSAKNRGKIKAEPKVTTSSGIASVSKPKSIDAFRGGTKPVHRPEIMYADNPEMLERELRANEKRFTVAPLYNKGGDQLVTDEAMKDVMSGATRRRN